MKHMAVIALILAVCTTSLAWSQDYDQLIEDAENKLYASEYGAALGLYRQAFEVGAGGLNDLFNAACAAAQTGDPDAAFMYLNRALDEGIIEKQWFEEDEDLVPLHTDDRWDGLLAALDARLDAVAASFPEAHPEGPVVDLPEPRLLSDVSVEEALQSRRSVRTYMNLPLSLAEVSQLLWAAYGLNKPIEDAPDFLRGGLRTAPSAGALYPLDVYLVARNVTGLASGIYLYKSETHQLITLVGVDRWQDVSDAGFNQPHFETAAAAIVYSAIFERNTQKYGERGRERYVCMDLGHSAENVYLQAYALKIGTCAIGAFSDLALKQVIRMTRAEEPLYIMPLGKVE
jgi:SagB-type dehydrogenase family enzyme